MKILVIAALCCTPSLAGPKTRDLPSNIVSRLTDRISTAVTYASRWEIVENSPEEGFLAGVVNTTNSTGLYMACIPPDEAGTDPLRAIFIAWNGTTTALGTWYEDLEDIPVFFRWADSVNQANRPNWFKSVSEELNMTAAMSPDSREVSNVLDRVVETSSVNVAVSKTPPGTHFESYARTRFAWLNDPPVQGMEDCGQSGQTGGPLAPSGDDFECSYSEKRGGGFTVDCDPKP